MTASDVGEQASERLARRLQEEEDQLTAFHLQHQFNGHNSLSHFGRIPPVTYSIPHDQGTSSSVLCLTSDEEEDKDDNEDDIKELSFVSLSDNERDLNQSTSSTDGNQFASNDFNTAFSIPDSSCLVNSASNDVIILDDSVVEDERPGQSSNELSEDENLVLTVGRTTRSQTNRNDSDASITITNNNLSPVRSLTYSNKRSRSGSSPDNRKIRTTSARSHNSTSDDQQITDSRHHQSLDASSSNSDNQPSTSSGRRPGLQHIGTQRRQPQIRIPQMSISSRVIINGVPIHRSHFSNHQDILNNFQTFHSFMPPGNMWQGGNESMTYEEMIALDDANTLEPGQGLSVQSISQNTLTKHYSKSSGSTESCNICLTEFDDGEKVRTLPCFHLFHSTCIDNWLSRKPECPVCRSVVGQT